MFEHMEKSERPRLAPGREPWDPVNGLRIGGFVGALTGAAISLTVSTGLVWLVPLLGIIGAAIGFWSEKRNQSRPT